MSLPLYQLVKFPDPSALEVLVMSPSHLDPFICPVWMNLLQSGTFCSICSKSMQTKPCVPVCSPGIQWLHQDASGSNQGRHVSAHRGESRGTAHLGLVNTSGPSLLLLWSALFCGGWARGLVSSIDSSSRHHFQTQLYPEDEDHGFLFSLSKERGNFFSQSISRPCRFTSPLPLHVTSRTEPRSLSMQITTGDWWWLFSQVPSGSRWWLPLCCLLM